MRHGMYWPAGENLPLCVLSLLVHVWPDDCVGDQEGINSILTGSNWPVDEGHESLSPSAWSSCWLPLAHEWVDVLIVSSLAKESHQPSAGVVGSASYSPTAAGPVDRAVDHIPCSLYPSTAHQNVTYSLFPEDVESPVPVLPLSSCLLLVNPSSSPLLACPGTCVVAEFVSFQYPTQTPLLISSLDWERDRDTVSPSVHLV